MSEWRVKSLDLPPGVKEVVGVAGVVTSAVGAYLQTVVAALKVVEAFAETSVDLYTSIVNQFITEAQNFINDINEAGVSVLIDYPQNINPALFNPVSQANLGGTVFDANLTGGAKTAGDVNRTDEEGQNRLQAIASRRRNWNPPSRDLLNYPQAITRIVNAFDDPTDPLRPQFSDSANTFGAIIMVQSQDVSIFLRLVSSLNGLFGLDDLDQIQWPGFEDWFADLGKSFTDLTEQEICSLDLTVDSFFRNAGRHPNFIMNVRLGELFPPLKEALDALSEILEQLRPNGDITSFVEKIIEAFEAKIARLEVLATRLEQLGEQLQDAFGATSFAMLAVESNTGNNGFKLGVLNSTGAPQFENSLVCSVLVYTGGPGVHVLKTLFGQSGEKIESSVGKAVEEAGNLIDTPVLRP